MRKDYLDRQRLFRRLRAERTAGENKGGHGRKK
jgi:hypothetical protein